MPEPIAPQDAETEIEDIGSNPDPRRLIGEIIAARYGRRALLGAAGTAAAAALAATEAAAQPGIAAAAHSTGNTPNGGPSTLTFAELRHQLAQGDAVAEGYEIQMVIRWGEPILADAPEFNVARQSAAAQARQFGYNNDYLDFFPLPRGSRNSDRGLLWANHEYTNSNLMFPGLGSGRAASRRTSAEQVAVEIAAHGGSVVEVKRDNGRWTHVRDSRLNRRITGETPFRVAGPAAGHPRLRTNADPTGTRVLGMLNNCAGGHTLWGTLLTCEENFNFYFGGEVAETDTQRDLYRRYGIVKEAVTGWGRHVDRFDLDKEPNEPNRFGWICEIDPYDLDSVPVKRTALGRFKHECCTMALCPDGRVAFYSGDDERFEYIYKFVTARPWNPQDRAANRDLLDEGTLYVGRFDDDGKVAWLSLVHGQGPLTEANGFASQADVVIEARRAADLLGATPMDRPEDVETNPVTGRVYAMLTNNTRRTAEQARGANPRARNVHGHVLEIIPPAAPRGGQGTGGLDHAAAEARWALFLVAGAPAYDAGARYHRATSADGWLSCPDNCAFDSKGRIWIGTDGSPETSGVADGLYAADTTGYGRALTRLFYQAPTGAEVCGPCFTPDERTLFLAIQHPGEDPGSTFEQPSTRWPDFQDGMPPRPSVIAIIKEDGGVIGT
jgi:uncharacterized protein